MTPKLPAEKIQYRRGLALGLTLAETFSVVVFVLLLASASLLVRANTGREDAERRNEEVQEQLDEARVDLAVATEMLQSGDTSYADADAWLARARELRQELIIAEMRGDSIEQELEIANARVDALLESAAVTPSEKASLRERAEVVAALEVARDSLNRARSLLEDQAAELETMEATAAEGDRLLEIVGEAVRERNGSLTPEGVDSIVAQAARARQVSQELSDRERVIRSQAARLRDAARSGLGQLRERVDSLEYELDGAEQERDDAIGRAEYRERQLTGQGFGIDPPPCWRDGNGEIEYIFRVKFTEGGTILYGISPAYRASDVVVSHARNIEDGREYASADFRDLTRPIYDAGRLRTVAFGPRGCRFYVQLDHQTGELPGIYQERMADLEAHFFYRKIP